MKKSLVIALFGAALLIQPFFASTHASAGGWETMQASAAWNYDGYRVERLAFASGVKGPFKLGSATFVTEPSTLCPMTSPCDRVDVILLSNGMKKRFAYIPVSALDPVRFALSGNRVVYASPRPEANRWSIVEQDLETGVSKTLVENVFLNGATQVDVLADGETYYLRAYLDFNGKNIRQAAVYVYNPMSGNAEVIGPHWELREETLLDANDGVALVKLTFADGYKELWLHDTRNIDHKGMTRRPVPGTWTAPDGDMPFGRFLDDGSVAFFKNFVYHTFDPKTDETALRHEAYKLSWSVPFSTAIDAAPNQFAWLDPDGNRFVVTGASNAPAASEKTDAFEDRSSRFDRVTTSSTDTTIRFEGKTDAGATLAYALGFGYDPAFGGDRYVYWRGVDGNVYEATLTFPVMDVLPRVKFANDAKVYVADDSAKTLRWLATEQVAFDLFGAEWNKGIRTVTLTNVVDYRIAEPVYDAKDLK